MPWIQINSATPKLVSEIAKGRREQSRAQQPRDPQPETLAVPGQGQNSQARGKEWLKPFYQDQGRSGSYSVLGSFRGVSTNYRYHGRVYLEPDSLLQFFVHLPHPGLNPTPVVLPTATYLWCNTNFTMRNLPGYLCNTATRENPRKQASLAPESLLQVEYFSCCRVKSETEKCSFICHAT